MIIAVDLGHAARQRAAHGNPVEKFYALRPGQLDQLRDCNVGQSLGLEHQFFDLR